MAGHVPELKPTTDRKLCEACGAALKPDAMHVCEGNRRFYPAVEAYLAAKQVRGGENRGKGNIERDRGIHDAKMAGKAPKQIARDKELPLTTVYHVLRKPRP